MMVRLPNMYYIPDGTYFGEWNDYCVSFTVDKVSYQLSTIRGIVGTEPCKIVVGPDGISVECSGYLIY